MNESDKDERIGGPTGANSPEHPTGGAGSARGAAVSPRLRQIFSAIIKKVDENKALIPIVIFILGVLPFVWGHFASSDRVCLLEERMDKLENEAHSRIDQQQIIAISVEIEQLGIERSNRDTAKLPTDDIIKKIETRKQELDGLKSEQSRADNLSFEAEGNLARGKCSK